MTDRPLAGLRVAQLIDTNGPGGAERMFAHLCSGLVAAGASVLAFVNELGEPWLGMQLERAGIATIGFRIDRALSPAFAGWVAERLVEHRIDVAHSHEFTFGVYGAWAGRIARRPHLFTMHGGRYYAEHLRRRVALGLAARSSASVVAVSEPTREELARTLRLRPSRIEVIPNGVPYHADAAPTLRSALGLGAEDRLLVAVGNLYPVKGHTHLLEAVAELGTRWPRLHVAIAGRGDLEAPLRAQAARLGIERQVHLLGLREDIPDVLASADVFVLPSLSEGLPLAVLEAMFAARPIVASDVGGIATVLGPDGVVVPPGDAGALARAIDGLLSSPQAAAALGQRARARAGAAYSVEAMVARYGALYLSATSGSRSPASARPGRTPA